MARSNMNEHREKMEALGRRLAAASGQWGDTEADKAYRLAALLGHDIRFGGEDDRSPTDQLYSWAKAAALAVING
jgi:hypothetical protein